jgi:hypothetical protein
VGLNGKETALMDKILQENKTGLLYAGLIGLIASDIIPGGGDAAYFYIHKKIRDKWTEGKYTSKQYWAREALIYYTLNAAWWTIIGTAVYFTPGNYKNKLKTGVLLIGVGIAVAVIVKNIEKDEKENLAEIQQEKEDLYKKNAKTV